MNGWQLEYNDWNPEEQPRREALCALGNGYFVTRGADESARPGAPHYPGTYLAGGYNRAESNIAGRTIVSEDLVNWPNWLFLSWRPAGEDWFDISRVTVIDLHQRLDLKTGVLHREIRCRDHHNRTTRITSRRLVSMADQHLAALEWSVVPEDWSGTIEIRSEIDGRIRNYNVKRYRALTSDHFAVVQTDQPGPKCARLVAESHQSRLRVAMCARLEVDGAEINERVFTDAGDRAGELLSIEARKGETIHLEKIVAVCTSRDHAISEPTYQSHLAVQRAGRFDELLNDHARAWDRIWRRFDLEIEDHSQMLLRLHTFHLLQTASPKTTTLDVGIPARGWHGEAYRGHILWDELFIFPLLNLRMPDLTRTLLMYRYRRLDEARANARKEGLRGARFPWQSGSDGREESQVIHLNPESGRWIPDSSNLQRHVNHAIVFNVYQYLQATNDFEFLRLYGAEMLLEIARYLAELAEQGDDGRYHIRRVMGPDEFHERYPGADKPGLDDNAYTNVMTSWVLERALHALNIIGPQRRAELCEDLHLEEHELRHWEEVSRILFVPFHDDDIISQFAGYGNLKEIDWERYRAEYDNLQRMDRILEAEGESPAEYKIAKQADVLMLFYLFSAEELTRIFSRLGYTFEGDMIPRNTSYYLQRTSHGSTLSKIVHSWVLARSDREGAWQLFTDALRSDIGDVQGGTTPEGIHLGAMAGTVDLIHRCFTGIEIRDDCLRLNPALPQEIKRLSLCVQYRGHWMCIHVTCDELVVQSQDRSGEPVQLMLIDDRVDLHPGESRRISLAS